MTTKKRFWEEKHPGGRERIFDSPETFWKAACGYFEWAEDNPLQESKVFQYQGEIVEASIPKMRAMTLEGLCLYLGISLSTWYVYNKREEYLQVCVKIMTVLREQKFTGAAADLLNPAIIARDLGLKDKQELQHGEVESDQFEEQIKKASERLWNE